MNRTNVTPSAELQRVPAALRSFCAICLIGRTPCALPGGSRGKPPVRIERLRGLLRRRIAEPPEEDCDRLLPSGFGAHTCPRTSWNRYWGPDVVRHWRHLPR